VSCVDIRLCFFGDSYVAGFGDGAALGWVGRVVSRARVSGQRLTAYNLGIRGNTTVDVTSRLPAEAPLRLADGDVVGVVFSAGVNDTMMDDEGQRVPSAGTLNALRSSLEFCANAHWPVLVIGPPPIADEQHNRRIEQLSNEIAALCRETGHTFVSTIDRLANDAVWRAEVAADDGAHPGAEGYARLADVVWPPFQSWLARLTTV
jgi:lysophospholipase L1-like esterase